MSLVGSVVWLAATLLFSSSCYIRYEHVSQTTNESLHCTDGVHNGGESDLDCGGSCGACLIGAQCELDGDCLSNLCDTDGRCAIANCEDGRHNGEETDVDCGGDACDPCGDASGCDEASDCVSGVCEEGLCQTPTCNDGVANGEESDVDCGGDACAPCTNGQGCLASADCVSTVCSVDVCAPASCADGVQNGSETDVDCGGDDCGACSPGQVCEGADDCQSLVCDADICQAVTCDDGVQNGDENDVDCGGSTCRSCGAPDMISMKGEHSCAVTVDHSVYCWGKSFGTGSLGVGDANDRLIATRVSGLGAVAEVAASYRHSCAITLSGELFCWGDNSNGQTGPTNLGGQNLSPVRMEGLPPVVDVALSRQTTCAAVQNGDVYCWGNSPQRAGAPSSDGVPGRSPLLSDIVELDGGLLHICGRTSANTTICWGANDVHQLGYVGASAWDEVYPVPGLDDVAQLFVYGSTTCALRAGNALWCWGGDTSGALGNGAPEENSAVPSPVIGLSGVTSAGGGIGPSACATEGDGRVHCWGSNNALQLGDSSYDDHDEPFEHPQITTAVMVSSAHLHSCALMSTDDIRCWGQMDRLGRGSAFDPMMSQTITPDIVRGFPDGPCNGGSDCSSGVCMAGLCR